MSKTNSFLRSIDLVNNRVGKIFGFAILPLTFCLAFEVVMRYVFNRPTIWAWDVAVQLGGLIVVLGAGFALLHKSHIVIDIVVVRFPLRVRAILDLITSLLFFFAIGILLWKSGEYGWRSFLLRECTSSYWEPPIYPLKMAIPIGIFLLLLQGIAKFIRDLNFVIHPEGGR